MELARADRSDDFIPCQPELLLRRFVAEGRPLAAPLGIQVVHSLACAPANSALGWPEPFSHSLRISRNEGGSRECREGRRDRSRLTGSSRRPRKRNRSSISWLARIS